MRAATTGRPAAHRAVGRVRPIAATRVAPMRIEDYAAIVDGCPGGEGAFVAAGFWLAQVALVNVALALSGAGRDDFGAGA
ncbi:hypothetical protein WI85_10325 [Burkholderia ubonensis]|uniref:hypothetical protein n=1 Tax=Burkholderia ubonensis TaxID=101571 RepID=UPI000751DE9C|nr:hypothetical protein [Burkholderia ubonensis]KVD52685.1 hypothetical protein WI85_10325 [Burkholderia ubonensis]